MFQSQDVLLINAVIEAAFGGPCANRALPPTGATGRLFALVKNGERDFETLRAAVLNFPLPAVIAAKPAG